MGEMDSSNKYEGQDLCTVDDVYDELGPIIGKSSSTVFPDDRKNDIIGRWCRREQSKFYQFVGVYKSQLKGNLLEIARDIVLYRVCIRALRKIQANRTGRPGGVLTYVPLLEQYEQELTMLEHHVRIQFYPHASEQDMPYPLGFEVEIVVVDNANNESLPGARVYVDTDWVATTWKDGKVVFYLDALEDDSQIYDINVRMVGYHDSAYQEVSEDGEYVFRLTAI